MTTEVAGGVNRVDTQEKGMVPILGGMEWDPVIQNGLQFKAYALFIGSFISALLHLMLSDRG